MSLCECRIAKLKDKGPCVRIRDIVILKDENVKRVFWKLAKVVELLKGKDGIARAALTNVATENGPPKILKRSITQLIPIEVASSEEEDLDTMDSSGGDTVDVNESTNTVDQSAHPVRPRRAAAIQGEVT